MFNSTLFGEIKVNQSINQLFNTSSISISSVSGQSGQSSQSQSQSGTKDTTTETTKDTTETTKDTTETKLKLKEKIGKNKLKKLKKLNDQLLLVNGGGGGVGGAPEEVKSTTKKDGHLVADIIPETRREKIAQVIEKNSRTLFVGNLPVDVIEKKNTTLLKSHFCQFGGELESVRFRSLVCLRA